MMSLKDYGVNTAVLFHTGFADGECNRLMFEGMKKKIVNDIRSAFEKDSTLSPNITSNLDFTFSGYKVKVEYTFSCHDENEAEAESFKLLSAEYPGRIAGKGIHYGKSHLRSRRDGYGVARSAVSRLSAKPRTLFSDRRHFRCFEWQWKERTDMQDESAWCATLYLLTSDMFLWSKPRRRCVRI